MPDRSVWTLPISHSFYDVKPPTTASGWPIILPLFESEIATFVELRADWQPAFGPVSASLVSATACLVNSTTPNPEGLYRAIASFCESISGVESTAEYEDIASC